MVYRLRLDIIAPDEELAKIGACYGTVARPVALPFTPFPGLRVIIPRRVPSHPAAAIKASQYTPALEDPLVITVEKVTLEIHDHSSRSIETEDTVGVFLTPVDTDTLDEFLATVEALKLDYAFVETW